jgi:hypothetical protein
MPTIQAASEGMIITTVLTIQATSTRDSADDTGNATDANDQKPIPEGDDNGSSEEDVVPAGDKDSADGTGNADDTGDNSSEEDFVRMTMAVPTIQATQAISFDRKYAVPAKLKECLSVSKAKLQTLLPRSRLSVAFAYTRN